MSKDGRSSFNFGVCNEARACLHMSARPVSNPQGNTHCILQTSHFLLFHATSWYDCSDICHDVVIVFQHSSKRPRYLLGSSFDRLVYISSAWYVARQTLRNRGWHNVMCSEASFESNFSFEMRGVGHLSKYYQRRWGSHPAVGISPNNYLTTVQNSI